MKEGQCAFSVWRTRTRMRICSLVMRRQARTQPRSIRTEVPLLLPMKKTPATWRGGGRWLSFRTPRVSSKRCECASVGSGDVIAGHGGRLMCDTTGTEQRTVYHRDHILLLQTGTLGSLPSVTHAEHSSSSTVLSTHRQMSRFDSVTYLVGTSKYWVRSCGGMEH